MKFELWTSNKDFNVFIIVTALTGDEPPQYSLNADKNEDGELSCK